MLSPQYSTAKKVVSKAPTHVVGMNTQHTKWQDRLAELRSREDTLDEAVKSLGIEEALGGRGKGRDPYEVRVCVIAPSVVELEGQCMS